MPCSGRRGGEEGPDRPWRELGRRDRGGAMEEAGVCPHCGSTDLLTIRIAPSPGEGFTFHACHHCEARWWTDDGGARVSLEKVLESAKRIRRGTSSG